MGWEADVLRALPDPLYVFDRSGALRFHNGRHPPGCVAEPDELRLAERAADCATETEETVRYAAPDGREHAVAVRVRPVEDHVLCVVRDVTRARDAEEARASTDMLATVGRLAASVAHDVNNMLTVIAGHAQLLSRRLGHDEWIEEITRASERAAEITRRVGAFTRPVRERHPAWFDLRTVAVDLGRVLSRLLVDHARVTTMPPTDDGPIAVHADLAQVEQIVLNLATKLQAATAPGGDAVVSVRGEDQESVLTIEGGPARDPEDERGGLDLETVVALARENDGTLLVRQPSGGRVAFELRLPVAPAEGGEFEARPPARGGDETVLVVDDEAMVRSFCGRVLRLGGYQVLEAALPAKAVDLAATFDGTIHILVTDIVMPGMGGRELAARLAGDRPGLKVLYVSGHPGEIELESDAPILSKPFGPDTLANAVREVLDG